MRSVAICRFVTPGYGLDIDVGINATPQGTLQWTAAVSPVVAATWHQEARGSLQLASHVGLPKPKIILFIVETLQRLLYFTCPRWQEPPSTAPARPHT